MCSRHLGFLFFLWFPGVLHAQNARTSCRAPILEGGVFAPHKVFYPHGQTLVYNCENGRTTEEGGWWASVTCVDGIWSHMPRCKPFSGPTRMVHLCGAHPSVINGDVVETTQLYLRYQCNSYYKLVGPEKVVCYGVGEWSEVPTCREAFCALDTDAHHELIHEGVQYIKDGETERLRCVNADTFALAKCTDTTLTVSKCCGLLLLSLNVC